MGYNKPYEIIAILKETAGSKCKTPLNKLIVLAILGGAYIALGSMFAVITAGGMPGIGAVNPGIVNLVFGLTFPLGFVLVTLAGAELFTSTTAVMAVGVYTGENSLGKLFKVWTISYFGNFIGASIVVFILAKYSHIFKAECYTDFVMHIAHKKTSGDFLTAFVKGIGANWLVCLASFLSYSAKDATGKIFALWAPVTAFVAMGFEHSIANMFFIPMAKVLGSDISWGTFIVKNLIPVTLGNIVGGVLFVALSYSFIYYKKSNS